MSNIIGLLGFIGSGKGTVANILVENYNFRQDSFASSLKDACAMIFDWPRHMLEGDTTESREWREIPDDWWSKKLNIANFSPRYALQYMGTNVLREHFNQDIWFLTLENRIRKNPTQSVVISDVRFPNEVEFIKKQKGKLILINRGKLPEWYDIAVKANSGDSNSLSRMMTEYKHIHQSEWAWAGSEVDYFIDNSESIEFLHKQLNEIAEKIIP